MNAAPAPAGPWRDVDGIVLLDKPEGLTSNAALQRVRRAFRARKAGHTGSISAGQAIKQDRLTAGKDEAVPRQQHAVLSGGYVAVIFTDQP